MRIWLFAPALLTACLVTAPIEAHHGGDDEIAQGGAAHDSDAAHFHHVRLNVTDPTGSIKFYAKLLGAVEVDYYDKAPALFTERSFLLLNKVDEPPPHLPHSAISHIGWGSVNGQADFDWLKSQGVEFETPITQLGNNYGMYFFGPDKELVELWTGGKTHRFDHVHLWATDVQRSADWYKQHLGLQPRVAPKPKTKGREISSIWMAFMNCDNVGLVLFGRPDFDNRFWPGGSYTKEDAPEEFQTTKGRAVNHLAFSYRDIKPVFERMKAAGVEIVEPIANRPIGHKSFYVMAPDKILIEIVEAKPIPDASWE